MIRITHASPLPPLPNLLSELKGELFIDFTSYDNRLEEALKAAVLAVERHMGALLLPATITLDDASLYRGEPLPYGPVTSPVGDVVLTDGGFLLTDTVPYTVTYPGYCAYAGSDNWELDLRRAVVLVAADRFDTTRMASGWQRLLAPFRTRTWA